MSAKETEVSGKHVYTDDSDLAVGIFREWRVRRPQIVWRSARADEHGLVLIGYGSGGSVTRLHFEQVRPGIDDSEAQAAADILGAAGFGIKQDRLSELVMYRRVRFKRDGDGVIVEPLLPAVERGT